MEKNLSCYDLDSNLLKKMLDEDSEIVTSIWWEGDEELANNLAQDLMEKYEDVEVEIHQGSQPVLSIFSVERIIFLLIYT